MIRVYFKKLENSNLEITEKMLNDILSYIKRQENEIKTLEQENRFLKQCIKIYMGEDSNEN